LQKNLVADLEFINKNNNNNSTFELRSKANQRTTITNCECGTQFLQIALELDSRARNKKGKEKSEEGKRKTWTFSLFLAAGDQLRLSFPARFCFSRLVEFNAIQNVQNGIVFYFKKWSC
jgi:hypothetical protein